MTQANFERNLLTLDDIVVHPSARAVLSFKENASLRTAEWATRKFGGQVLINKVIEKYNADPEFDASGHKIHPEDLLGPPADRLQKAQEAAEIDGLDIADDLKFAARRVARGYNLSDITVRSGYDTSVIIGSLVASVKTNPENLTDSEQHLQAAAGYILEHLQISRSEIGDSTSYLI